MFELEPAFHDGVEVGLRPEYVNDREVFDEVVTGDCYRLLSIQNSIRRRMLGHGVIVDLGGHIGCSSAWMHHLFPEASIDVYEMHPENIPILSHNVGEFAQVFWNCVTHRDLVVVADSFQSDVTGGSMALPSSMAGGVDQEVYALASFNPPLVNLDDVLERFTRVDLLKMDIENSELSLFEHCKTLDKVGCIVGEFHERDTLVALMDERFPDRVTWYDSTPTSPHSGIFISWRPA